MKLLLIVAYSRPDIRLNYSQCSRVVNGDAGRKPRRQPRKNSPSASRYYSLLYSIQLHSLSHVLVYNNEHYSKVEISRIVQLTSVRSYNIYIIVEILHADPRAHHRNEW